MYCSASRTASALGLVRDRDMRADAFGDKKHDNDHHTTRANVSSDAEIDTQQPTTYRAAHATRTKRRLRKPPQASVWFTVDAARSAADFLGDLGSVDSILRAFRGLMAD